jgi:hypothetical protein
LKNQRELRCEFWNFLYSQGFPSSINDSAIRLTAERVDDEAYSGKQLKHRFWSILSGGNHDDDVALTTLLAGELGLKKGLDWDWGTAPDGYHFDIAFSKGRAVEEFLRLLNLYHEALLVALNANMREYPVEGFDFQFLLAEEWKQLKEEELQLKAKTVQALRKLVSRLEKENLPKKRVPGGLEDG